MAEAALDLTAVKALLECAICLGQVKNHRALPCQHLFCQKCLEPLVTGGGIPCPVCRKVCHLEGKPLHSLPRSPLAVSILDTLCENCELRKRTVKCPHCDQWVCSLCYEQCQKGFGENLKRVKEESIAMLLCEQKDMKLIHDNTSALHAQLGEVSDDINQTIEDLQNELKSQQRNLQAALKEAGHSEISQMSSLHDRINDRVSKLTDIVTTDLSTKTFEDQCDMFERWSRCLDEAKAQTAVKGKCNARDIPAVGQLCNATEKLKNVVSGLEEIFTSIVSNTCTSVTEGEGNDKNKHQPVKHPTVPTPCTVKPKEATSGTILNSTKPASSAKASSNTVLQASSTDMTLPASTPVYPTLSLNPPRPRPLNYDKIFSTPHVIYGSRGSGPDKFNCPSFVAVDPTCGNIVVSDTKNNRVVVLDKNVQFCRAIEDTSLNISDHHGYGGVSVDSDGNIFVTDTGNNRIQKISQQGQCIDYFGQFGNSPGQVDHPIGIVCDSNQENYVCDLANHRVQVASKDGKFYRIFGSKNKMGDWAPNAIALFGNGDIVVSNDGDDDDEYDGSLEIFGRNGKHLETLGTGQARSVNLMTPGDVTVDREGNIIVTDARTHLVHVLKRNGQLIKTIGGPGRGPGQFKYPTGVACTEDGGVIIVDQGNHRIQVFKNER